MVLEFFEKYDLKRVRLVSKEWCSLATQFLFDKIYISPRQKDVEVFGRITTHPVLSHAVKELVYDTSHFMQELAIEDYYDGLDSEVTCVAHSWEHRTFTSPNPEINEFVEDLKKRSAKSMNYQEVRQKHSRDSFIVEGYQLYLDYAKDEQQSFESGMFLSKLYLGLHRLNNLQSVVFNNDLWHYYIVSTPQNIDISSLQCRTSGSPLVRSWKPFHLRPCGRNSIDVPPSSMADIYHTIAHAMSVSNRKITRFQLPTGYQAPGLLAEALTYSNITDAQMQSTLDAFSLLEELSLQISTDPEDRADHHEPLYLLQTLLAQTVGLKRLSLSLLDDWKYLSIPRYLYTDVFPIVGSWPKLAELELTGVAISGHDLLGLINGHANVRLLKLSGIELTKGTWEGVFTGMSGARIEDLILSDDLTHSGGAVFRPSERDPRRSCSKLIQAMEDYVVNGGRHPCLLPNGDPDAPLCWYLDLFPEKDLKELIILARQNDFELPKTYLR